MSYWGGAWSSLKFSVGSSVDSMIPNLSYRYLKGVDGNLTYKNNRAYKYVAVHVAKQMAAQIIEGEVHKLFPRYQRYLEEKLRNVVLKQQDENRKQLIKNGEASTIEYGRIWIEDASRYIFAKDKYGNIVHESLMIYFDMDYNIKHEYNGISYNSKTLCFIDLAPTVTVQSGKNIVLTPVQGRDFTRKEMIAGGDITFSVNGHITIDAEGVYPENDVKKFIQIMQHGGIIKVNHFLFGQFNIDSVIIKDFQLGQSDCKNMQPYSFTCVAVEPDEDVAVYSDTINVLNKEILLSPMNKWYKFILNSKLAETVARGASSTISSFATTGLDALVPNI